MQCSMMWKSSVFTSSLMAIQQHFSISAFKTVLDSNSHSFTLTTLHPNVVGCNWRWLLQNGPSIMFYVGLYLTLKSYATSIEMAGPHLTITPAKVGTPTFHNNFTPSACFYSCYSCKQRSIQTCTVLHANTDIPPVRPSSTSEAWSWCSLCPGTYTDKCLDLTSGWCLQPQTLVFPVWVQKYSKFKILEAKPLTDTTCMKR